jgi:uncharacterized RDD family membrane protein YckC
MPPTPDSPLPASVEPPPASPSPSPVPLPSPVFAGFWRRLAAFFVDSLLLGGVGLLLGLVAFDALAALGNWGRVVGFAIALPYLGLLNSRIGGGRTLGKRLLGLRTVGLDGQLLSPARGLARAALLGLPWFVNGAALGPDALQSLPLALVVSLLVFWLGLGNLYLLVFDRPSRRGLHDWAVGSVVVREPLAAQERLAVAAWRGHRVVLGVLALAAVVVPVWLQTLMGADDVAPMIAMRATALAQPGVREAGVSMGKSWVTGTDGPRRYATVHVLADSAGVDHAALAQRVAAALIAQHPAVAQQDQLEVRVAHGYDIGISSLWRSHQFTMPPSKWLEPTRPAAS